MIWVCFNLRQETSASDQANPWATGRSLLVLVPGIEPQLTDTPNDKHEFLWIWFNHLPIADVLACISWGLES